MVFLWQAGACLVWCTATTTAFMTTRFAGPPHVLHAGPNQPSSARTENRVCILRSGYPEVEDSLCNKLGLTILHENSALQDEPNKELQFALTVLPYSYGSIEDYCIGLSPLDYNTKTKKRRLSPMKPIWVDFCPPTESRLGQRTSGATGKDLLLQAIGKDPTAHIIYDLTAGLAQDALIMARGGGSVRSVHMVERDPILSCLLQDATRRMHLLAEKNSLHGDDGSIEHLARVLSLEQTDALEVLSRQSVHNAPPPDIIYLDPMFPVRKKRAAVKKNMQILHGLLESQQEGEDMHHRMQEEARLLEASLRVARTRVVVKRPTNAPALGGDTLPYKTTFQVTGPVNRWDVYLTK